MNNTLLVYHYWNFGQICQMTQPIVVLTVTGAISSPISSITSKKNQATTLNHLFWLWHHLWIESLHYYYCQVYFIRSSYLCLWLSCRATVINILQKKYQVNLGPKWVIYNENILLNKTFNFVSLSMQKGNRFPFTITCIILKYGSLKKQK